MTTYSFVMRMTCPDGLTHVRLMLYSDATWLDAVATLGHWVRDPEIQLPRESAERFVRMIVRRLIHSDEAASEL